MRRVTVRAAQVDSRRTAGALIRCGFGFDHSSPESSSPCIAAPLRPGGAKKIFFEIFWKKTRSQGKHDFSRRKAVFLLDFFHGDLMLSRPCVASGLIPGFPVRKRWSRLSWRCAGPPVGAGVKIFSDYWCDVERW